MSSNVSRKNARVRARLAQQTTLLSSVSAVAAGISNAVYSAASSGTVASNTAVSVSNVQTPLLAYATAAIAAYSNEGLPQGLSASNRAFFASNVATRTSNAVFPMAAFASNAAFWASNNAVHQATFNVDTSNTMHTLVNFSSNLGYQASNMASNASNMAITSSNTLYPQGLFASNAAAFGSNVSSYASNLNASNFAIVQPLAVVGSNAGAFTSNAGAFTSNASTSTSNVNAPKNTFAWSLLNTFASNLATNTSNHAVNSSNLLTAATAASSNAAAWALQASTQLSNYYIATSNAVQTPALASCNATVAACNLHVGFSNNIFLAGTFASNAGAFGSNAADGARVAHNALLALSVDSGTFASNAAGTSSNTAVPQLQFASDAGAFASNTATATSNALVPSCNIVGAQITFAVAAATYASNAAVAACNAMAGLSNTAVPTAPTYCNSALFAQPDAVAASNISAAVSNAVLPAYAYASNAAIAASNGPILFARSTATGTSNAAFPQVSGMNILAAQLSNAVGAASNSVGFATAITTAASNSLYSLSTQAATQGQAAAAYASNQAAFVASAIPTLVTSKQPLAKSSNLSELLTLGSAAAALSKLELSPASVVELGGAALVTSATAKRFVASSGAGASFLLAPAASCNLVAAAWYVNCNLSLSASIASGVSVGGALFSNDGSAYAAPLGGVAVNTTDAMQTIDPDATAGVCTWQLRNASVTPAAAGTDRCLQWEAHAPVLPAGARAPDPTGLCNVASSAFHACALGADCNAYAAGEFLVGQGDVPLVYTSSTTSTTSNTVYDGAVQAPQAPTLLNRMSRGLLARWLDGGQFAWASVVDLTSNSTIVGSLLFTGMDVDNGTSNVFALGTGVHSAGAPTTLVSTLMTSNSSTVQTVSLPPSVSGASSAAYLLSYTPSGQINWVSTVSDSASSQMRSGQVAVHSPSAAVYATTSVYANTTARNSAGSNIFALTAPGGAQQSTAIVRFGAATGAPTQTIQAALDRPALSNTSQRLHVGMCVDPGSGSLYLALPSGSNAGTISASANSCNVAVAALAGSERVTTLACSSAGVPAWVSPSAVTAMTAGPVFCAVNGSYVGGGQLFVAGSFSSNSPLVNDAGTTTGSNAAAARFRKSGSWSNDIGFGTGVVSFATATGAAAWAAGQWTKSPDLRVGCVHVGPNASDSNVLVAGSCGELLALDVHGAASANVASNSLPAPLRLLPSPAAMAWTATYGAAAGAPLSAFGQSHARGDTLGHVMADAAVMGPRLLLCGQGTHAHAPGSLRLCRSVPGRDPEVILPDTARPRWHACSTAPALETQGRMGYLQRWDLLAGRPLYNLLPYSSGAAAASNTGQIRTFINSDRLYNLPVTVDLRNTANDANVRTVTVQPNSMHVLVWNGLQWKTI